MGIIINFQNVENLIFFNSELKKKLPDFKKQFDGYAVAQSNPAMKSFGQKMLIDFMNLVKDEHIQIMTDHFKEDVTFQKIDVNVCHHYEFQMETAEDALNSMKIYKKFLMAYREGDRLYLSTWR